MCSPGNRRDTEMTMLMMKDFKVDTIEDSIHKFYVQFKGPESSLYQGGEWKVAVELPAEYPFKPPSILFSNKIYHPNIDWKLGSICLDVLKEKWSSMCDLVNVFEILLPQLLLYPNPEDPLNGEAGALMLQNRDAYNQKVKEYCLQYAKAGSLTWKQDEGGSKQEEQDSEDISSSASGDEEKAGPANP